MYCEPLFLFFNILSDQRLVDKTKPPMNVPTARSSIPYSLVTITVAPVAAVHKGQWAKAGVNKIKEDKTKGSRALFIASHPIYFCCTIRVENFYHKLLRSVHVYARLFHHIMFIMEIQNTIFFSAYASVAFSKH